MKEWLKEKMAADDGSVRKLWGHRLMKFGIVLILLNFLTLFEINNKEVWELKIPNATQLILYIFGLATVLLGVGNVTDIWKKDNDKLKK